MGRSRKYFKGVWKQAKTSGLLWNKGLRKNILGSRGERSSSELVKMHKESDPVVERLCFKLEDRAVFHQKSIVGFVGHTGAN